METTIIISSVFLVLGLAVFAGSEIYRRGVSHGRDQGEMLGKKRLDNYIEAQDWVYAEGSSPSLRYNKRTGTVQRRYLKPSSLAQMTVGPAYTEWRTVKPRKVAIGNTK